MIACISSLTKLSACNLHDNWSLTELNDSSAAE